MKLTLKKGLPNAVIKHEVLGNGEGQVLLQFNKCLFHFSEHLVMDAHVNSLKKIQRDCQKHITASGWKHLVKDPQEIHYLWYAPSSCMCQKGCSCAHVSCGGLEKISILGQHPSEHEQTLHLRDFCTSWPTAIEDILKKKALCHLQLATTQMHCQAPH